ncbi:hypothetical protein [Rhizobium sp. BK176]|uniref:hypothetical protein n=1 Tax=Rhizobium sp. BK176 TaxID=2587071 RepID=UPI00216A03F1|nr:hypothetical protein [Rhizobium sp. BK176]MCS4090227.1 hypothetical protein [Rhizobium sp. BK176]
MEALATRLSVLAREDCNDPGSLHGVASNLARLSRKSPKSLAELLREFGDTHADIDSVGFIKVLEVLGFEQFADFPLPNQFGMSIAFVRHRDCLLGILTLQRGARPELTVVGRAIGWSFQGPTDGFPNDVMPLTSSAGKAHRVSFNGASGLMLKLHQLDRHVRLSNGWWSLTDMGSVLVSATIGTELVGQRERILCRDYDAIRKLVEERGDAVPSILRYQFDADHRFTLADVLARKARADY